MTRDRYGEELEALDGTEDEKPWTWQLRPTESAKAMTMTMRCCLCRQPLLRSNNGWCASCRMWPINVTPMRTCERGHSVNPDGWCHGCHDYVLTVLDPKDAQWVDTGVVANRLGKEQIKALVAEVAAKLSGPGWPEKRVPLRRDMIPRSWKRYKLRVVGQTPLGHDIVLPDDTETPGERGHSEELITEDDTNVPF